MSDVEKLRLERRVVACLAVFMLTTTVVMGVKLLNASLPPQDVSSARDLMTVLGWTTLAVAHLWVRVDAALNEKIAEGKRWTP